MAIDNILNLWRSAQLCLLESFQKYRYLKKAVRRLSLKFEHSFRVPFPTRKRREWQLRHQSGPPVQPTIIQLEDSDDSQQRGPNCSSPLIQLEESDDSQQRGPNCSSPLIKPEDFEGDPDWAVGQNFWPTGAGDAGSCRPEARPEWSSPPHPAGGLWMIATREAPNCVPPPPP